MLPAHAARALHFDSALSPPLHARPAQEQGIAAEMAAAVRLLPVGSRRREARPLELQGGKEQELALPWDADEPAALVRVARRG